MNYYQLFVEHIKFYAKHTNSLKNNSETLMLLHLIEILGEKEFNQIFTSYFLSNRIDSVEDNFDNKFFDFHKSMRQADLYINSYNRIEREPTFEDKRKFEYVNIGGHLDMIFWNLIHITDVPYTIFKTFYDEVQNKSN